MWSTLHYACMSYRGGLQRQTKRLAKNRQKRREMIRRSADMFTNRQLMTETASYIRYSVLCEQCQGIDIKEEHSTNNASIPATTCHVTCMHRVNEWIHACLYTLRQVLITQCNKQSNILLQRFNCSLPTPIESDVNDSVLEWLIYKSINPHTLILTSTWIAPPPPQKKGL